MNENDVREWFESLAPEDAARWLAAVLPRFADDRFFDLFEQSGVHVTRSSFLSPIPEVRALDDRIWQRPSDLAGIDLNEEVQKRHLSEFFPVFREEYAAFRHVASDDPDEFYFNNDYFSGTDALVLYCMVRHYRPGRIIEVGSGFSTKISAAAIRENGCGVMECVEPFPTNDIRGIFPAVEKVHISKVEDLGLDPFLTLKDGDILFIDSSHVSKIGGDVNFLYLEVLPRIAPGVIVHIHDVYLPFEYKEEFVKEFHLFWTEQYLFQAFLQFNSEFEILYADSYMAFRHSDEVKRVFPNSPWIGGGSFWIRRAGE